jgi:hypothetical protein
MAAEKAPFLPGRFCHAGEARMFTAPSRPGRILAIVAALILGAMFIATPASAQKVPDKALQEVLIKGTLLTFNDANVTGIYSVMHAKLSKPFRDQFPPERLKEVFKTFREKHIDFDIIAGKTPVASQEPKVTDSGILQLYGYFDTAPSRVVYELEYILSDGEWKPTRINVNIKPVEAR